MLRGQCMLEDVGRVRGYRVVFSGRSEDEREEPWSALGSRLPCGAECPPCHRDLKGTRRETRLLEISYHTIGVLLLAYLHCIGLMGAQLVSPANSVSVTFVKRFCSHPYPLNCLYSRSWASYAADLSSSRATMVFYSEPFFCAERRMC